MHIEFKDDLVRLWGNHLGPACVSFEDVRAGDYFALEDYKVADELGGGPVRVHGLGSGYLSETAFVPDSGPIPLETTRYGLMPMAWPGEAYINESIQKTKELAKTNPECRSFDDLINTCADWDYNFQHFLTESFPRIYAIYRVVGGNYHIPVAVSDCPHAREVISICFPDLNVAYLGRKEIVRVDKNCLFVAPILKNIGFHSRMSVEALKYYRYAHLAVWHKNPKRFGSKLAYFGRKSMESYAGNHRVIVNDDVLFEDARAAGYEKTFFDGMSNIEKIRLLAGTEKAIMPIGANLMNILLVPEAMSLGVILHPIFRPIYWFTQTFNAIGLPLKKVEVLDAAELVDGAPKIANSAYRVEEQRFREFLKAL